MKIAVEVPDDLLQRAKAKAALEGISLTELVERGLHLVMEQPDGNVAQGHTDFPLISGLPDAEVITDELVAQALEQMDEEEMVYYANFVRHG